MRAAVDIIAVLVKNGWFLGGQTDAKGGQKDFISAIELGQDGEFSFLSNVFRIRNNTFYSAWRASFFCDEDFLLYLLRFNRMLD